MGENLTIAFLIVAVSICFVCLLGIGSFCIAVLIVRHYQEHRRNGE